MVRRRRSARIRSLSTTNAVAHEQSTSGSSNGRRGDTDHNRCKKRRTECCLRRPRHLRTSKSLSNDNDNDDNGNEKDEDSVESLPCFKHLRSRRCRSSTNVRDCEDDDEDDQEGEEDTPPLASTTVSSTSSSSPKTADAHTLSSSSSFCLPRQVESKILKDTNRNVRFVVGVDEAGRGPLAGPVVAAAVIVPTLLDKGDDVNKDSMTVDPFLVEGVVDSKKITKEEDREDVYQRLMEISSHNNSHDGAPGKLRWAVAVIDAARIDEINILQATMEGMRAAVLAVMGLEATTVDLEAIQSAKQKKKTRHSKTKTTTPTSTTTPSAKKSTRTIRRAILPSIVEQGCYVVCSDPPNHTCIDGTIKCIPEDYYAIIDGDRLPHDMPCKAESLVKGDSKEFCVAAASILAKVTRDRLMHGYSKLYPNYDLHQHKGYPTAAHMSAVRQFGASPIHRRTFAPLKHMSFDKQGKVIND